MNNRQKYARNLGAKICLSGAFDIIHVGHINMFEAAKNFGEVNVILNSDEWIIKNIGFIIMSWEQRRKILLSIRNVDKVIKVDDTDNTVVSALYEISPTVFGNGGLRTNWNTPEREMCLENNICLVYGLGGGASKHVSIDLREKIRHIK